MDFYFKTVDDSAMCPKNRDVFFAELEYSFNSLADTAPRLPAASERFNPDSVATFLIDETLDQPKCNSFSPDGTTLYISDAGAISGTINPKLGSRVAIFNTICQRTSYAYDVSNNGTKIFDSLPSI